MRRRELLATGALVGVGAAAGLRPARAVEWQRHAGKTITVLIAEHPVAQGIRERLPAFEAATGIKVELQALAEDLYFDRMELALRARDGIADVYFQPMDSTAFTQWKAGLIRPLSPFLADPMLTAADYDLADFPEGFLVATTYPPGEAGAEHYGIPVSFECYILFYNKDHVATYLDGKVPATMPELLAAAETVKERSGGSVAGAVMRGIRSDTPIDTVTAMVYNAWGEEPTPAPYNVWFDGDWSRPRLTDPRIVRGLADYAGLMRAGPPNILSIDWPEASLLFQQGRAAFFIDASLFGPGFEDPSASQVAGRTGYAPIPPQEPGGRSWSAHWMWGLGIPANAREPEAGWLFIQFMTNRESEPLIGKLHGGATRLSTWQSPDYTNALNPDYVAVVKEVMRTTRSSVVFREGWAAFATEIVGSIHEIHAGTAPEQAAQALQAKFEAMLRG
jgi:multiple sugar transport system substrate-binding protein